MFGGGYISYMVIISFFIIKFVNGYSPELECYQSYLEVLSTCCQEPNWQGTDTYTLKCSSTKPTCMSECIFNETKILPNGEIDMAGLRTSLQMELSNDSEFIPIMMKAFDVCVMKLQNKRYLMRAENDECNPFALTLFTCVHSHALSNCPDTKWTPSSACNNAKQGIQRCFYM